MRHTTIKGLTVWGLVLPMAAMLAGCMGGGAATNPTPSGGGMFSGWFGASQPAPAAPQPVVAAVPTPEPECPPIEIRDGGTNFRQGDAKAVKVQFSIKNVARECATAGDSVVLKVGIEGLAIIGTAGKPGPASAPITIVVTRGDKTVATRAVTAKVMIPADEEQAQFRLIEDGIKVPPGLGDAAVTVGFKGEGRS
jgi:hypothetical protein